VQVLYGRSIGNLCRKAPSFPKADLPLVRSGVRPRLRSAVMVIGVVPSGYSGPARASAGEAMLTRLNHHAWTFRPNFKGAPGDFSPVVV